MVDIHIRTSFEHVAEALVFLAPHAARDSLSLSTDEMVDVGAPVHFRVTLEDETRVIEGHGRCRAVRDRGPGAERGERYEVTITALDLDEKNGAMLERILRATSEPPRPLSLMQDLDELDPADEELALPDDGAGLGEPPTSTDPSGVPHAATRVVRTEDLLREASSPGDVGVVGGVGVTAPPELVARAAALVPHLSPAGPAPTLADVLTHAMRVGLAALEAAHAEDAFGDRD